MKKTGMARRSPKTGASVSKAKSSRARSAVTRLATYRHKRDFTKTPEPEGGGVARRSRKWTGMFVIHEHDATRLHYDLRLELDGVLRSWAVPKGPSLDPKDRRLAVEVEDHPLSYAGFEGVIPEGQYGGGPVVLWDRGRWAAGDATHVVDDPADALRRGSLSFTLEGEKLHGAWALARIAGSQESKRPSWILVKKRDEAARAGAAADVVHKKRQSVKSGRTLDQVRQGLLARGARATQAPKARRR